VVSFVLPPPPTYFRRLPSPLALALSSMALLTTIMFCPFFATKYLFSIVFGGEDFSSELQNGLKIFFESLSIFQKEF
jgi:hypothetical protein